MYQNGYTEQIFRIHFINCFLCFCMFFIFNQPKRGLIPLMFLQNNTCNFPKLLKLFFYQNFKYLNVITFFKWKILNVYPLVVLVLIIILLLLLLLLGGNKVFELLQLLRVGYGELLLLLWLTLVVRVLDLLLLWLTSILKLIWLLRLRNL